MGTLASSISSGEKKEDKCTTQTKGDSRMNNQTPRTTTIVCEEVFHENSVPSEGEVLDYAKKIGIDPEREPHLLPIALNGLMQPLPQGWRPCFDGTLKRWYYYNDITKASQWEHPLDDVYRNLVKRGRCEGYNLPDDVDLKVAKEDLKSLEETSEQSSTKENKLDKTLGYLNENDKSKDSYPRAHQPLLLRRKQLQYNANSLQFPSLHVAKLINKTRKGDAVEEMGENQVCRMAICKVENSPPRFTRLMCKENNKTLQPLRRVKTPVHTIVPPTAISMPVKGILNEAVFSSGPKRLPVRLNPIKDLNTLHESQEKRKFVKFADFEHKSIDMKYHFSDNEGSLSDEDSFDFKENKENSNYQTEKFKEKNEFKMGKKLFKVEGGNRFSPTNNKTLETVDCIFSKENEGKVVSEMSKKRFPKMNPTVHSTSKNSSKEETTRGDISVSDTNMMNITTTSISSNSSSKKQLDPEIADLRNAIKSIVSFDNKKLDMESYVKGKSSAKLANFEEKLAKEIQEKLTQLKMQQIERLNKIKCELEKQEESEKARLKEEASNNLNKIKTNLNKDVENKEKEIKNDHEKAMEELVARLEAEKADRIAAKMIELKAEEDQQITDIKNRGLLRIEEVKTFFETQAKETEEKFQNEVKKLEHDFSQKLETLETDKQAELKGAEAEWEERVKANSMQNKLLLESTSAGHKKSMDALREKFQKEEEALKHSQAERNKMYSQSNKEPNTLILTMEFEKVKCEKRIIEDKYRLLKEKYLQLKREIESAVEKKLQCKSRKKKEEVNLGKELNTSRDGNEKTEGKTNSNDTTDPLSNEKQMNVNNLPKTPSKPGIQNELHSDDPSLSLTLPNSEHISHNVKANKAEKKKVRCLEKKKLSRGKLRLEHSRNRPNCASNKMWHPEGKTPANSQGDTYLHYNFQGQGISNNAENDFYIQKIIQEQEAVRTAREYLLQQKHEIDVRYNIIRNNNSTMQELQQQDRDLTEMEASLYRTKALLGEKMIRLRLLGQTFTRIIQDIPNGHSKVNNPMDSSLITSLNTIPANDTCYAPSANTFCTTVVDSVTTDQMYVNHTTTKPSEPTIQRVSPNRSEIESKLKDMQDWLQKTAPK